MESTGLIVAARRRWYLVLLGLVLTAGLCYAAAVVVPVKYQATARILLLPPASVVGKGGNPYLMLGGLDYAASVLARAVTEADVAAVLLQEGATRDYTVAPDVLTSGPVLLVTVNAGTAAESMKSLNLVVNQLPVTLADLQSSLNVAQQSEIQSTVITRDDRPTIYRKSQTRAVLVAVAAGLGLTTLLVAWADARLLRRRRTGSAEFEFEVEDANQPSSTALRHG